MSSTGPDAKTPPTVAPTKGQGTHAHSEHEGSGVRSSVAPRRTAPTWFKWAALLSPTLLIVASDLALRQRKVWGLRGEDLAYYALSVVFSALIWSGFLGAAARREGRSRHVAHLMLVVLGVLTVGAQLYTFGRYRAYMNHRAVLVGTSMLPSIGQQLWSDRMGFLRALGPPLVLALLLPLALRRWAPPDRTRARVLLDFGVVGVLLALFVSPARGAELGRTPDVLYLTAMGQLGRARWSHNETVTRVHPGPRSPAPLPQLQRDPSTPRRNVLFVLNESVRAKSSCTAYVEDCPYTPFSNRAAPSRLPLMQMRTVDSTTAISLLVMWAGLSADSNREDAHRAPLLWEYARAAGMDTAYWTAQNMMFANSGLWLEGLQFTRYAHAGSLEENPPLETGADDGRLVDQVLRDLPNLRPPFVGVVHLSNTHFPYRFDPADAPFQPESADPMKQVEIYNRYLNAVHHQDRALARLIEGVRARAPHTVIVYTSDHGEQMFEKGSHSHTGTLFEPEVHVPAWIDADADTLTPSEQLALRALRDRPLYSVDVFPTLMDIAGLWRPEVRDATPFGSKILGESLLRGGSPVERIWPMSNCNGLWACAFKNWGAAQGPLKLIATQSDENWLCFDALRDPEEQRPLPLSTCSALLPVAERLGRPF